MKQGQKLYSKTWMVIDGEKRMIKHWTKYIQPDFQENHNMYEDIFPSCKAAVSWKFGHCSARASLKIWWIITPEH